LITSSQLAEEIAQLPQKDRVKEFDPLEHAIKRCFESYSKKFDVAEAMSARREQQQKEEEEKKKSREEEKMAFAAQQEAWKKQDWGSDLNWINLLFTCPEKIIKQQFKLYKGSLD
jgi:hypothetical protein